MNSANCLGLNGGGANGTMELHQVKYFNDKLKGDFLNHFDYMAGTSTGALMVALFVKGYSPDQVIEIYEKELPKIFHKGMLRQVRGLSKYSNEYLKGLSYELIGDTLLGDLKYNILIPALNSSLDRTKIFKSNDPKDSQYKLVDVIIASAAAPTFFPAHQIGGNWYKDGGLSENNPSEILLKECRAARYGKVNILSITSGNQLKRTTKGERRGSLFGAPAMIDEMLQQQDINTHGAVSFEYNTIKSISGTYIRCESARINSSGGIDDVSKKNLEAMRKDGELSVLINKEKLDKFYINTLK